MACQTLPGLPRAARPSGRFGRVWSQRETSCGLAWASRLAHAWGSWYFQKILPGCAAPFYVSLRSGFVVKQQSLRYPGNAARDGPCTHCKERGALPDFVWPHAAREARGAAAKLPPHRGGNDH